MCYEARDTTLGDTLGFMVTNTNQLVTLFSWLGSPLTAWLVHHRLAQTG